LCLIGMCVSGETMFGHNFAHGNMAWFEKH
jgi:hypothetical protein